MVRRSENYWRALINGMKNPMPESGSDPPELEKIIPKSRRKKTNEEISPSERKVTVQKITTEIYIMTDTDNRKFAAVSKQQTQMVGEMTLEEAMKIANNAEG
jgi:hypothetical protein